MAAVARTVSFRGQKLTRQATSVTEDAYTLTLSDAGKQSLVGIIYVQLLANTVGIYYHSTTALTQTDGVAIPAGTGYTIAVTPGTPFYISAQTSTGSLDMVVL